MRKTIFLLMGLFFVFSCSTHQKVIKKDVSFDETFSKRRGFATTQVFSTFLNRIAKEVNMSRNTLDKKLIDFIQEQRGNNSHGNWSAVGITEIQAKQIESLSDSHPYMDRVRKWISENINIAIRIEKNIARSAFDDIMNADGRAIVNPYQDLGSALSRQTGASPFVSLNNKQNILLQDIESLTDRNVQKLHRKNLAEFQKRGKETPSIHANGQEIIQAANLIYRKTGRKAMGEGCEEFTKHASSEVLSIKADIDILRAQFIEELAYANNGGKAFANFDELSAASKKTVQLTQEQMDAATIRAFKEKLGYTDTEATRAVRRLKSRPCRLY